MVRRFIYAGSCSVYGYTENQLYDEQAPTISRYPYGISKLQGEYATIIGYPGLNLDATQHTDPKVVPFLPTSPEHLPRQWWVNLEWWADNGAAVHERWARWMLEK